MRTNRFLSVALAGSAAVVGLAGCGSNGSSTAAPSPATLATSASPAASKTPGIETLSAEEIYRQAKTAVLSVSSLKVTFDGKQDGQRFSGHLSTDRQGDCVGEMGMGSQGHMEIITTPKKAWIKPDAAFWKAMTGQDGAAAAELFKGRWLTGTVKDKDLGQLTSFCNLKEMFKDLADDTSKVTKGATTTVDGTPAVVLHAKDSDGAADLYVATQGKPYILKAHQAAGDGPGTLTFSDFGAPVQVQPPAADQTIDFSKLRSLGGGSAA